MIRYFAIFLALAILTWGRPAAAQNETLRIAAVVNDQVISMYDLSGRIRLVMASAGLENTPENRQRLIPAVLRSLIDEALELQEAKRLNISVSTTEIEGAVKRVAGQNHMGEQQFQDLLKKANIPLASFVSQIRASIAWHKVIDQKIQPTVDIGDDQVDEYLARLKATQDKPQFHLQEIFLGVDSLQQDDEVKRTAERLAEQIRNGANFSGIARQFSQNATAAVGGDLGWVQEGAMDPEIEKVVTGLKPGQTSDPVRTVTGYYLIQLVDRRQSSAPSADNAQITLEHFFLPGPANAKPQDLEALRSVANTVAEATTSCPDFASLRKSLPDAKTVLPEKVRAGDLAPVLREAALSLPIGKASAPIALNNGIFVMMVCSREGESGLPNAEDVRNRLGNEKVDLLTRRYLRDLRQSAFVDVRA